LTRNPRTIIEKSQAFNLSPVSYSFAFAIVRRVSHESSGFTKSKTLMMRKIILTFRDILRFTSLFLNAFPTQCGARSGSFYSFFL
jgi:hypothetical protein